MNERFLDIASPAFLAGGGTMGAVLRGHDWSTSALCHPASWSQSLKVLVGVMLASGQPMFVAWGRDAILLYNDGYAPMLGKKHGTAVGRPFFDVWPEVRTDLTPLFDRVFAGEPIHMEDISLVLDRGRGPEETHFNFSYTPVRDEAGEVVGFFSPCTETSEQVFAGRRLMGERERLAALFAQAPSFMAFLQGPDYTIELANPAYLRLTDMRDIVGKRFVDALPEAVEQGYLALLDGVRSSGQAYAASDTRYAYQVEPEGPVKERFVDFLFQPIVGADGTVTGVFVEGSDVTDRKRAEDHLRLMVNELNRRVKNTLATVQAIAVQTFRDVATFEHAKKEFSGRIQTLANAHDLLTETNWSGATMRQVINRTVGPHQSDAGERFDLDGPNVLLDPKMALALSMALNELCTNSTKYGALSVENGGVQVVWRVGGGTDGRRLLLTWIEHGGPPVAPPGRKGFGSRLIERSLAAELDGEVAIRYEPTGVVCTIDAPLAPT